MGAAKKGQQLGDIGAMCLPSGMPRAIVSKHYPDEIVQTPGQVTIFVFGSFPIVIWTDGRGHPKDSTPSYNGHSIGHWVGDTRFVDTLGINETTPIDSPLYPHSGKLHLKWTIQQVATDTLHFHVTLYDEDAFKEPVTTTNIWQRKTDRRWRILDWTTGPVLKTIKNSPVPAKRLLVSASIERAPKHTGFGRLPRIIGAAPGGARALLAVTVMTSRRSRKVQTQSLGGAECNTRLV